MTARALTIAGSDSGGGAGIQADLKTFTAFRVFGMSAITAVTAQNTMGVQAIVTIPPVIVKQQIDAVLEDIGADAIKIGMLSGAKTASTVAARLKATGQRKIVLDPVMYTKHGCQLLTHQARETIIKELLPLALFITPNIPEAELLSGIRITDVKSATRAAEIIRAMGPKLVIIKGGHLRGLLCIDHMYDGKKHITFTHQRIQTRNTHGTGCTLSAAITACLALGMEPVEAMRKAGNYLHGAIKNALSLGHGYGPLNHFWRSYAKTSKQNICNHG